MRSFFYPKLAITNIKKNSRFYYPYILTCIATIAMFYVMIMIANNDGLSSMRGFDSLSSILGFGTVIVGIFSAIFLLYTNSFLIKRRKKELGLFNILGMEKRHIARILFNESIITGIFTIILGIITGIVFAKLIFLVLFYLVRFSVPIGFEVKQFPVLVTILLFGGINLFTLLVNVIQVYRSKPIELVLGNNTGEKEPKSRLWLTIIGFITLLSGYYIAVTTKSPLSAINLFFIAVLLVIIGTYCLFVAGSISLLKFLRRNKSFYYNKKNFIAVSSMFYRMKQNAVGLASICILSTMVLVMVSTTFSLYIGVQDALDTRYPSDLELQLYNPLLDEGDHLKALIVEYMKDNNIQVEKLVSYTELPMMLVNDGNSFMFREEGQAYEALNSSVSIMTYQDYYNITQDDIKLGDNEVLIYSNIDELNDSLRLFETEYTVKKHIESIPMIESNTHMMMKMVLIVVKDQASFDSIMNYGKAMFGEDAYKRYYRLAINLNGEKLEKIEAFKSIDEYARNVSFEYVDNHGEVHLMDQSNLDIYVVSKQNNESSFYSMYGGFLFLGLFLGLLFMCATVLIIYYKQISEGYDDKERYLILKKVGMSYDEIKTSIKSQILIIFFLPLSFAFLHIAFAFNLITKLLIIFNLSNVSLFLMTTVITLLVFSLLYSVVYALTAKAYYRIVS